MKKILLLILSLSLTACLTPKRLVRYTEPFVTKIAESKPLTADFCVFDKLLLHPLDHSFEIKMLPGKRDPLALLALNVSWDIRQHLFISPDLIGKQFQEHFINLALQSDLPDILRAQGKKLYIRIEQVPNDFYFVDRGKYHLYDKTPDNETDEERRRRQYLEEKAFDPREDITPSKKQLIVKYAFIEDKKTTAESTIVLTPEDKFVYKKGSWKRSITNYFKEYNVNLALTANNLLNEIMNNTK